MLRDWSDEWKNARLALELRGSELFQGETLSIVVRATVTLDTGHDAAEAAALSDDAVSMDQAQTLALEQLEARWRRHCDGALVDLKLVEPTPGKHDKLVQQLQPPPSSSLPSAPRTTLFHQESRLALLPLQHDDVAVLVASSTKATTLRVTLTMRCECTVRVRAEFWQRPLTLIARVTPNASRDTSRLDVRVATPAVQPLTSMLLNETSTRSHLFGLLREQTTEPPNLTRRVEHKLRVAKPLVLKIETKFASGNRVVIIARAANTHDALGVRVLDLQLHINQFAGAGSNASSAIRAGEYRVAKAPTDGFPVELAPYEQYNFVFIVEPTGSGPAGLAPSFPNAPHISNPNSQQSLLTLSWETIADADPTCQAAPLLQPITEHHTILWSPHPHRVGAASVNNNPTAELFEVLPKPPPLPPSADKAESPDRAISVVRRGDRLCPLSVTLAPLHSLSPETMDHRVGVVETLCVVVANRSTDGAEFDLSLVVPPPQPAHRSWLAFEASHHLGRVRPGTIIRKSVRLVFLRHGRADLNALLLFDHISRTWFLPPLSSPSTAWEVFVHP